MGNTTKLFRAQLLSSIEIRNTTQFNLKESLDHHHSSVDALLSPKIEEQRRDLKWREKKSKPTDGKLEKRRNK